MQHFKPRAVEHAFQDGDTMTGRDLRKGRELKGWTQEATAVRLGVSQPISFFVGNRTASRARETGSEGRKCVSFVCSNTAR